LPPPTQKNQCFLPSILQTRLFVRPKKKYAWNLFGSAILANCFFPLIQNPKIPYFKKNFPTFMAKKLFAKKKQFYSKKTCLKPFSKKTLANSDHRGEVNAHRVA